MKVFVAGATGVLGRRAVRELVAAGHDVTGVARSPAKGAALEKLGARPTPVDLFDATAVKDAVAGHDVVCNLATHIPPLRQAMRAKAWVENDRIRSLGSRNLVDGALAAGAERYVQESITFLYPDRSAEWIDEETALDATAHASVLDAEGNAGRFAASGGAGVVLRFGVFYAPDSFHTLAMVSAARRRVAAMLGKPDGYLSPIHVDDAATAVVASLAVASGIYNVVDDEPMTKRDHFGALAAALGVGRPRFAPGVVGRVAGARNEVLARSQRVANRRLRETTPWTPRFPSAREGWPAVVAALNEGARP